MSEGRRWRNRDLSFEPDVRQSRWLWILLFTVMVVVAPLAFWLVMQMEYVELRYEIEELRSSHEQLEEMEHRLRTQRAGLEVPSRVERLAARKLKLVRPAPDQVVVVPRTARRDDDELVAQTPGER